MGTVPKCFPSYAVLRVQTCLPFTACNLGGFIWEAMDGGVTRCNLQPLRADIVRKATDERRFSCNGGPHCALGKSCLGLLTFGDVPRDLGGADDEPCGISDWLNRKRDVNQSSI